MADPTCTLNPKHSKRKLETQREELQGYCEECAEEVASQPILQEHNSRARKRQAKKDRFIKEHPELVDPNGTFIGEAIWLHAEREGTA